ncbi:MAG: hypothetical protein Q4Q07_03160 [Tissierellia bacterium]|nr:hypothetical protein [Tissierellia bacterium]
MFRFLTVLLSIVLLTGCGAVKSEGDMVLELSNGKEIPFECFRVYTFQDDENDRILKVEGSITEKDRGKVGKILALIKPLEVVGEEEALASEIDENSMVLSFDDTEMIMYDSIPMDDGKYYYSTSLEDTVLVSQRDLIHEILKMMEQ